jgi:hypothetical protein
VEYFVQTAHPGTIQLDGDTASGRAYLHELIGLRDGGSHQNFAIYHDRYQRTGDGWKFAERVYEVRYLDTTPLTGSRPGPTGRWTDRIGCRIGLPCGIGPRDHYTAGRSTPPAACRAPG